MQALILAAGMGRRLGEHTKGNTKCMVRINEQTLISRVLDQLSSFPISRIIIVTGYEGGKLRAHVGNSHNNIPIVYVDNPIYDKTNNIYSLYLAKDALLEEDTLLIESDLIFEDSLLRKIMTDPHPNIVLVDKYEAWMDGTMVIVDKDNKILNFIPKKAFNYADVDSYYKTVNIYKFSKDFLQNFYVPFLEAYCRAIGHNEYYEQVLRVITTLDHCDLKALPLSGEKWYEIDDIQDLDIAETLFADMSDKHAKYHKRYGGYWRFEKLLDFCYLVNPYFPTPRMKDEMRAHFDTLLCEYPSGMYVNSLLMAKNFVLNQEYVVVGNGAAELIKSLMAKLEGTTGIILPSFEEYYNRLPEGKICTFTPQNADFSYTAGDVMEFFNDKDINSLLIINPDNPTGNFLTKQELFSLIEWSAEKNIRLIVDESFVDFSDEGDLNSLLINDILANNPHLIVVKSISKSYGVPGLRLGLMAGSDRELLDFLRKDVSIWNINSFAEYFMQIYSKYDSDYQHGCKLFREERDNFLAELKTVPFLRTINSQANYFLCEITDKYTSGELTRLLLEKYDILIKDCGSKFGFEQSNYVRIAVRDRKDNRKLTEALQNL